MKRLRRRGCAGCLGIAFLFFVAAAVYQIATWPDVAALARSHPETTAFIERYRDRHGRHAVQWKWVPWSRISPHAKRAVLVGEDINFFTHSGFDVHEVRQALADAWRERRAPRGASTLTQQLAKNLYLSPAYDPVRKLREAALTVQMEKHLSKRRILEMYLNVAEFGPGIYGIEAGARHYFGKSAADLEPREAAELAAGLPRPSRWHPGSSSPSYQRRVESLLRRMQKARFLDRLLAG